MSTATIFLLIGLALVVAFPLIQFYGGEGGDQLSKTALFFGAICLLVSLILWINGMDNIRP